MESSQTVQWVDVQSVLHGQHIDQVHVSQYVVNIGPVQGGVVNLAPARRRAAERSRPCREPPHILPRSVPGFMDRSLEQDLVGEALARGEVVDIHGPDGTGKTSLASRAMQAQLPSAYPDGMVYLSARHETREDLLQELFDTFFESDERVKVTENDVRRQMAGKRALIAVDDANLLEEGEAQDLAQVLPQCSLLVTGREQQIWQGRDITLQGLPGQHAVRLFEQHWGTLAAEERPTAEAICQAVGNVPLNVIKIARTAAQQKLTLDQVLQQVRPKAKVRDALAPALALIADQLSAAQRLLLGALAAAGGPTVGVEALPVITGLGMAEITRHLSPLQEQGLVSANSPRCSLDDGLRPYIEQAWTHGELQAKAAEYYSGRATALRRLPRDPDEGNVLSALDYYVRQEKWQQVVTLVRSIDRYLASTGRWGEWRKRINQALQAARELGDRATEAWAQNQLGVIAMGAGEVATARQLFRSALSVRRALSDRSGMVVTRWNLHLLTPPPPPPWDRLLERLTSLLRSGGSWLPGVLATVGLLAAAALLAVTVIAATGPGPVPRPSPTAVAFVPSPTPLPPTVTLGPTATAPPSVEVWLAEGCGGTYAPGTPLTIQAQSSVPGRVAFYLVDGQGERRVLFEAEALSQQLVGRTWVAPEGEGSWGLEANLNHGQATGRCGLTVATPIEPEVGIWLAEGCGRQYRPGTATQISLRANVDGRAAVWLNGSSLLFRRDLVGGETYSVPWNVGSTPGAHDLRVVLEDGGTASECAYSVQAPPKAPTPIVSVWLAEGCGRTLSAGTQTLVSLRASVSGQVAVYLASQGRPTQYLFSQRVQAGRVASRNWTVPELAGSWSLVAVLNGGQARGYCGFAVRPEVQIYVKEGCGHTYSVPIRKRQITSTVYLRTNVDGWVEVYIEAQGERALYFREWLKAGQEISRDWPVPRIEGAWTWEAVLNEGQARDTCAFQVEGTPPITPTDVTPEVTITPTVVIPEVAITLPEGCGRTYVEGTQTRIRLSANVDGAVTVSLLGAEQQSGLPFTREVRANNPVDEPWIIPSGLGRGVLEANLNDGQDWERCTFGYAPAPTEPVQEPTLTPTPVISVTTVITTPTKGVPTLIWTPEPTTTMPTPDPSPAPTRVTPVPVTTPVPTPTMPTPVWSPTPVPSTAPPAPSVTAMAG